MRLRNIPGAKEAIEASPYVIQEPQNQKGTWKDIFGNDNPVHIEVGMGKGRFITDLAALHPDINYIGIEMYDSVLLRAIEKVKEQEVSNFRFLCMDARLLEEVFAFGEIAKIYLNFSDPWPKARHAKRRLTSRQFLERYDKILAADGKVEFKTDNQDLFTFSLEEVEESKWNLEESTRDLHHTPKMLEGNVMTEYEEKFVGLGHPICKMIISR